MEELSRLHPIELGERLHIRVDSFWNLVNVDLFLGLPRVCLIKNFSLVEMTNMAEMVGVPQIPQLRRFGLISVLDFLFMLKIFWNFFLALEFLLSHDEFFGDIHSC